MKDILEKLQPLTSVKSSLGNESECYYDSSFFYKFIKPEYLNQDRQNTILRLNRIKNDMAVTPEFLLYEDGELSGYAMKKYLTYDHIDSLITGVMFSYNTILSFEERKSLMLELSRLFDYFKTIGFCYYDVHEKNILYGNNELKLIDLDCGLFEECTDSKKYQEYLNNSNRLLSLFTLSFLYNTDSWGFLSEINPSYYSTCKMLDFLPRYIRDFYEFAINTNDYIDDITEHISEISEDIYYPTVEILKKRLI